METFAKFCKALETRNLGIKKTSSFKIPSTKKEMQRKD